MEPLQTRYPVSASSHYLDSRGTAISPQHYTPLEGFHLERTVEGPAHRTTLTALALEQELDQLVNRAGGDALTNVTIRATNYDEGGHSPAVGWTMLGWLCMFSGVTTVGTTAMLDSIRGGTFDDSSYLPAYGIGVGLVGLGVMSFLLAPGKRDIPTKWQFTIDGQIVKRASLTVEPSEPVTAPNQTDPPPATSAAPAPATLLPTPAVEAQPVEDQS